jgi:hypothetical protein
MNGIEADFDLYNPSYSGVGAGGLRRSKADGGGGDTRSYQKQTMPLCHVSCKNEGHTQQSDCQHSRKCQHLSEDYYVNYSQLL